MKKLFLLSIAVLLLAGMSFAQLTTNLNLTVVSEASLTVNTANTALAPLTLNTFVPYTGQTSLTYKMRTDLLGTGKVTVQVANFDGAGDGTDGPINTDLTFTATDAASGATPHNALVTGAQQDLVNFGNDFHSAELGNALLVDWSIPNKVSYQTGLYTAVATFTISTT